jgi:hypothetical protein
LRSNEFARLFIGTLIAAAVAVSSVAAAPAHAEAQCTGMPSAPCNTPVRPDGKGIIGLAVIGAELGLFIPALVQNATHSNEWWPYLVFPLVGIGAGIGGGYALEQATQRTPEVDIAIMVASFVLIVPTVVGTLALASFQPQASAQSGDEDMTVDDSGGGDSVQAVQDDTSTTAPATHDTSGSGGSGGSSATPSGTSSGSGSSSGSGGTSLLGTTPADAVAGGPGLLRLDTSGGRVLLGVPVAGAMARYTSEELASMRTLQQTYDVQIPVVSGTF